MDSRAKDQLSPSSDHPPMNELLQARLSRRQALLAAGSATAVAVLGSLPLLGCEDGSGGGAAARAVAQPRLGFHPVAKGVQDFVVVPEGYTASVLYALGDPLMTTASAYRNDGSDGDFTRRSGDHHDGMSYFGLGEDGRLDPSRSDRGLLCINHENITQRYLHPLGASFAVPRDESQVRKEMECHGVSVVEVRRSGGQWSVVQDSPFNRRITAFTEMELKGPLRGSRFAVTRFSTQGTHSRGTLNNCANGYTPWGTYLTCEENWAGYFRRRHTDGLSSADQRLHSRYGTTSTTGRYAWASVPSGADDILRLDITVSESARSAAQDYRNEANTFGWVVEIDPLQPTAAPRKRSALGRFAHEGCWPGPVRAGEPLSFYMGDDGRGEYIYKFVSEAPWDPADVGAGYAAGDKYLDRGTLYVARFNEDGSGEWIALTHSTNGLHEDNAVFPFNSQAAVLVATRLAADAVGATRMDRPEWAAVHPQSGEVYLALTNNSNRGRAESQPLDAANPRNYDADTGSTTDSQNGNVNGHILRWREAGNRSSATRFDWDVFLFGARAVYPATVNASALVEENDFSSPDGLWFASNGVLWIQTDDSAYADRSNCMMLAAIPGQVGDGSEIDLAGQRSFKGKNLDAQQLRRFMVGPKECEITGIDMTPDRKTMFVNIQHPGEDGTPEAPSSNWPHESGNALVQGNVQSRPRSATVVLTRVDGGEIGL